MLYCDRYYGAFIDVPEGWYTPPAPLTPAQRENNEKLKRELKDISKGVPRQVYNLSFMSIHN